VGGRTWFLVVKVQRPGRLLLLYTKSTQTLNRNRPICISVSDFVLTSWAVHDIMSVKLLLTSIAPSSHAALRKEINCSPEEAVKPVRFSKSGAGSRIYTGFYGIMSETSVEPSTTLLPKGVDTFL
jgi:hypothetical protein